MFAVECFEWHSYIEDEDCMTKTLINNKWAAEEDLTDMDVTDIKDFLFGRLENFYNREVHSRLDLNLRQETGDKGSICGLGALYQAGVSTILSVSELKQMSYDEVKAKLGEVAGFDSSIIKKQKDKVVLELFYKKVCRKSCRTISEVRCVFPFNYDGQTYQACTDTDNGGIPWCSTQVDGNNNHVDGEWGTCGDTCDGTGKKIKIEKLIQSKI